MAIIGRCLEPAQKFGEHLEVYEKGVSFATSNRVVL
jgi:hypothetical protein